MSEEPKPYIANHSDILQQKATLFVQRHRDHVDAKIRNQLNRYYDNYKEWNVAKLYAKVETLKNIGSKTATDFRAYVDRLLEQSPEPESIETDLGHVSIDRIQVRLTFTDDGVTYFGQGHIFGSHSSDPFDRVAARASGVQVDFVYNVQSLDQYRDRSGDAVDYRDLGVPDEAVSKFKTYLNGLKEQVELCNG